jgi:hypothetical protein
MTIALENLNSDMYKQAHSQGMTFSMFLEKENPAPEAVS